MPAPTAKWKCWHVTFLRLSFSSMQSVESIISQATTPERQLQHSIFSTKACDIVAINQRHNLMITSCLLFAKQVWTWHYSKETAIVQITHEPIRQKLLFGLVQAILGTNFFAIHFHKSTSWF